MIGPTSDARQYRIIIRGECGRLLASLIDDVQVEPSHDGDTCLVALVRDDPEFWGLLEQLRDLALHVVSIQELGRGDGQADAAAGGRRSAHGPADRWLRQDLQEVGARRSGSGEPLFALGCRRDALAEPGPAEDLLGKPLRRGAASQNNHFGALADPRQTGIPAGIG